MIIAPLGASAQTAGFVNGYNSPTYTEMYIMNPNMYTPANSNQNYNPAPSGNVNPANYSNSPIIYSGNVNSQSTSATKSASSVSKTSTVKTNTDGVSNSYAPSGSIDGQTNAYSNLTANAVFGVNNFYPSGLVQWILLAIIILLIIILARRAFGADKKYAAAPMKHA